MRRHHDADLDQAVPKTQALYSVRNTPEPLTLKVRSVPCLCDPCIEDKGQCLNASRTDPWKLIQLILQKGVNKRKYQKRKRPEACIQESACLDMENDQPACDQNSDARHEENNQSAQKQNPAIQNNNRDEFLDVDSDVEIPEISIDFDLAEELRKKTEKKTKTGLDSLKNVNSRTDAVTDTVTDHENEGTTHKNSANNSINWINVNEDIVTEEVLHSESNDEDNEIEELFERRSKEFQLGGKNIVHVSVSHESRLTKNIVDMLQSDVPAEILWISILSAFESCLDFDQLRTLIEELAPHLPKLEKCV